MIPFWVFISPGLPRGLPGENFMDNTLGGLVSSIMSFRKVVHTVLIPASSITLAVSPTDWLQITQVGVRKAMSTPSSLRRFPTSLEFSSNLSVT
jgi:hypothetical protein